MAAHSRTTRNLKHNAIRQRIFDAAAELIVKTDYANVTVRMICEKAGISIGMFYRNFESKDNVLSFLYEKIAEIYETEICDSLTALPVEDRLIEFYTWIACFVSHFGLQFVRHFLDPNNVSVKSDYETNQVVLIGKSLLEKAAARGEITLGDGRATFDATHDILVLVKGALLDWAISGGTYNLPEYVRTLLAKTMAALL